MPWKPSDDSPQAALLTHSDSEVSLDQNLFGSRVDWVDHSFDLLDTCLEWLGAHNTTYVVLDTELVASATDEQWASLENVAETTTIVLVGDARAHRLRIAAVRHGLFGPIAGQSGAVEALKSQLARTIEQACTRERRKWLSDAVDHAPVGVTLSDPSASDNPLVYCNETFEALTGYEASELLGLNCRVLQCDETDDESVRKVRRAIDTEQPVTVELLNERRNGETFWNELTIAPVRDDTGELTHFVGFQRDVTEHVQTEKVLQQYQLAVQHVPDPIFVRDREGCYVLANEATLDMLEVEHEELIGTTAERLVDDEVAEQWRDHSEEAIQKGEAVRRRIRVEVPKSERVFHVTRAPVYDNGKIQGTVGIARDITEQHRLQEKLEERAHRDPLTGLANRRRFQEKCEAIVRERPEKSCRLTIAILALDDFNAVNERFGRAAGDDLLKRVGERLEGAVSDADVVARIGGDEFAIQLGSVETRDNTAAFADHLDDVFSPPFEIEDIPVYVSYSLGFSRGEYGEDETATPGAFVRRLFRTAEGAAREAKEVSGTSWRVSRPSHETVHDERIDLEHRIRLGLEQIEFAPFFHPIYDLDSREPRALELLARWEHPEEGLVSPGRFLPVAERAGLLPAITEQLLERAGASLERVDRAGDGPPVSQLYVNLSPTQVARSNVAEQMLQLVEEALPDAVSVSLEITEGQLLDRWEQVESLREAGFRIVVDDFGTGYSSLTRIKELPMDELKLDMEFVQGAIENESDRAILETVAELGQQLGVPVVGEGVENESQLDCIDDAGCTAAQGYFFGRPAPLEELDLEWG